jgi:hypothetical protein
MPWRKVLGEPGRGSTQHGRAMAIASVEIRGPQKHHSEDLVLAVAMGGFSEGVVCGTRQSCCEGAPNGKSVDLPIIIFVSL